MYVFAELNPNLNPAKPVDGLKTVDCSTVTPPTVSVSVAEPATSNLAIGLTAMPNAPPK